MSSSPSIAGSSRKATSSSSHDHPEHGGHGLQHLGWLLVFSIVYADIGTSIFYVPGILFLSIGNLATLAQIITTGVFISVALKYVEICARCPDGGGVVSITRQAFSTWPQLPLLGGSLITVDYFLTSAISGVSGLYYLATILPGAKAWVVPAGCLLFVLLAGLNIIGIRESAWVTSLFTATKLTVSFLLLAAAGLMIDRSGSWGALLQSVIHPGVPLTFGAVMIGYADTWLAYSGLESAAQVSGAMKPPVHKTALKAMWLVILTIAVLSPPITAAALFLLPEHVKRGDPESLLSALAFQAGGPILGIATVVAACMLLFMACNTAIVGNYHVNVRLADLGFLPSWLRRRHRRLGTPWISILISAFIPVLILVATRGQIAVLGDLYAFGLLGTLVLSSVAVDRLRWRDGKRGWKFWGGVGTSLALVVAWGINIVHKPHAFFFGGTITAIMMLVGAWMRRRAEAKLPVALSAAEQMAADTPEAEGILTLGEAISARDVEAASVMVSLRYANPRLLRAAAGWARGNGQKNVYVIFVDETPGLYIPLDVRPSREAQAALMEAGRFLKEEGIGIIPIWRLAEDAGRAVADAARELSVTSVYVGSSRRTFFWRMVRGRLLQRLASLLPENCNLIVVG